MKPISQKQRLAFGSLAACVLCWPMSHARADGVDDPAPVLAKVENFALLDHEGKFHEFDYYCGSPEVRAVVLFVQGNGCPLVRKRVPELNRLKDVYADKGVLFAMLNANPQDGREEIAREAAEFGIKMPVLVDESQLVATMLGVQRTGEAFLIDTGAKTVVFRGAIDDRMTYQKEKPEAENHYLKSAIDALLAGAPIESATTEAPGCKVAMPEEAEISYANEVAPILKTRCVACHTNGGLGPFAMSNYKKVRGWSEMIAEVVLARQMPPWHADPHIGAFKNDGGITPDEARILVTWIRDGSPRGGGEDPLDGHTPDLPEWHLGTPQKVVTLPEQKVAAEGVFDYRYVTVESPFDEDVWLTATEIKPGNTRVLHHVIVTAHDPGDSRRQKWITGYAPGTQGAEYPEGSAIKLPKGWKLKFQLHYTASGKDEVDLTQLGLNFSKTPVDKEFKTRIVMHRKFSIPPGAMEHSAETSFTAPKAATLYSINPHMHFRGKRMSFEAHYSDGRSEMLLSVPNYNFNWQRTYVFDEPKLIPAGTRIEVKNAWDNSSLNPHNPDPSKGVRWGEQSFEEMFFATLNYIETDDPIQGEAVRP